MSAGRPLRICAVGDATDIHVRTRTRCFAERGHDVMLLTELPSTLDGVRVEVPPVRWARVPKLRVLGALAGHAEALRRAAPDVVHVHYAHRIPAWMTGWVEPHPLVVSLMGGDLHFEERGDRSPRRRALTQHLLRVADLVTVKSDHMLERLGEHAHKAVRVSWGIDRRLFRRVDARELRRSLGLAETDRVIFSPRCLSPLYNIHLIVEAMPAVLERHPDAALVVSEASPRAEYAGRVRERVRSLGIESRVRFAGDIPHQRMPEYLGLAEVTVSVPASDGLPQSLLESLSCGAPAMLGRLDTYLEVVRHGESAWLVELRADAIAEGLVRLLGDEALRARLSGNGLQAVEAEHDFERQVARVEGLYRELMVRRIRAPSSASRLHLVRALLTGAAS